jgi:hypothetical protein
MPNLREILIRAFEMGTVIPSGHFSERCECREFSTVDAEMMIQGGKIAGGPDYDSEHNSWEYEFYGRVDGKGWYLVIGLDCESDFTACPRVALITVHRLSRKDALKKVQHQG